MRWSTGRFPEKEPSRWLGLIEERERFLRREESGILRGVESGWEGRTASVPYRLRLWPTPVYIKFPFCMVRVGVVNGPSVGDRMASQVRGSQESIVGREGAGCPRNS